MNKRKMFHYGMIQGLGCILTIVLIYLLAYVFSMFTPFDVLRVKIEKGINNYLITSDVKPEILTETDKNHLKYCIDKQFIVSSDQILGNTMNYYNSMLTFLLGLIALLSVLAVIYIRSSSKEHAENLITSYLESETFNNRIQSEAAKIRDGLESEYSSLELYRRRLRRLENEIDEKLELISASRLTESVELRNVIDGDHKAEEY